MNANKKNDTACANETIPSEIDELFVILSTSRLCEIICNHVPIDETTKLIHKSRKLRWRKARKVCKRPLDGVGLEGWSVVCDVDICEVILSLSKALLYCEIVSIMTEDVHR